VEEYNLYSEEIISRRIKKLKMTGKEEWVIEIGDEVKKTSEDFLIKENNNNVRSIFMIAYIYSERHE
jgi:hypothetical protein